jgi:hypothetical protein
LRLFELQVHDCNTILFEEGGVQNEVKFLLKGSLQFYRKLPGDSNPKNTTHSTARRVTSGDLGEHLVTRHVSESDLPYLFGCENFLLR